jgi:hypothetical protein
LTAPASGPADFKASEHVFSAAKLRAGAGAARYRREISMPETQAPCDTIVLVHGLWMTPRSWEGWKSQYEFEGRDHWTCAAPGWEAVADYALDWALAYADTKPRGRHTA